MNSKLTKMFAITAMAALPYSVMATPTITFEGEVTSQTCAVQINGQDNYTSILLPTVAMSDFGSPLAAGQTAGLTPFTISVTGCTAASTSLAIKTKFNGHNVDSTLGVLGNTRTGSDAASGFALQLLSGTSGSVVHLNGITEVAGLVLPANQTSASHEFAVQYYSLGTNGTTGKITAVTEYAVSYL